MDILPTVGRGRRPTDILLRVPHVTDDTGDGSGYGSTRVLFVTLPGLLFG